MGNIYSSFPMIHFEDIYKENSVLINTLQEHEQGCLIHNTIPANQEIHIMNTYLKTNKESQDNYLRKKLWRQIYY